MALESQQLNHRLREVLLPAYAPCPGFSGPCREMRWLPIKGHTPRGFCGATGDVNEVQLVLVFAEPGDPHPMEEYRGHGAPEDYLSAAYAYAYKCFREGTDRFHRNVRDILNLCWPDESFDQQLRKVWLVDSVLCSATVEGGLVSRATECECRTRYLERQLALFPKAIIVALGGKAYKRLAGIPCVLKAFAAAPPGCNYAGAKPSWQEIARLVHGRSA